MKLVLILLLTLTALYSDAIKYVEIIEDKPTVNFDNVQEQNFKRVKLPLYRYEKSGYWLKITLAPSELSNEINHVIVFESLFKVNSFVFDESHKEKLVQSNVLRINKKDLEPVYVKLTNQDDYLAINIETKEYDAFLKENNFKSKLYGISYGIIFSAFLYYLAFFIFNRQKSFIYYSLTQLSILGLLVSIATEFTDSPSYLIADVSLISFLIFSNLFTKEFLSTKKYAPKLNMILTFMIGLYIVETFTYMLTEMRIPTSLFLIFYLIAAIVVYSKTKFKPILFYLAGWSIMIFSFILADMEIFLSYIGSPYIDIEAILHICAPLESMILAFALSYKLKLLEASNIEKENLLMHQSKLASMGEMINNIAHQWRQPLTHISYIVMNINTAFKHEKLDAKYLNKKSLEATAQLEYMSKTIDDFKNFYVPKKEKELFNIYEATRNAISITSATLNAYDITVELKGDKECLLRGYDNEYSQVVLNLISNAKDAMIQNKTKNPLIKIEINENSIKVEDNAGGINPKIQTQIYEPYFTTKSKGTGIGLYMSKVILETHFKARFYHKNIETGTCFYIEYSNVQ